MSEEITDQLVKLALAEPDLSAPRARRCSLRSRSSITFRNRQFIASCKRYDLITAPALDCSESVSERFSQPNHSGPPALADRLHLPEMLWAGAGCICPRCWKLLALYHCLEANVQHHGRQGCLGHAAGCADGHWPQPRRRPATEARLLSDNGPCYVSSELRVLAGRKRRPAYPRQIP